MFPAVVTMTELNDFYKSMNKFLLMTIKNNHTLTQSIVKDIKLLGLSMNIKLGIQELQPSYLKSKEFISLARSKICTVFNRYHIPQNLTVF